VLYMLGKPTKNRTLSSLGPKVWINRLLQLSLKRHLNKDHADTKSEVCSDNIVNLKNTGCSISKNT
jgi:hypothetical protein